MIVKRNRQEAFTLIELLVVIAVIGLLSAIVLISLKSAQKNAKTKAGMQFYSSLHHALLPDAVGFWSFDNVPGGSIPDDSGNNLSGEMSGTPTIVNGMVRKAVEIDYQGITVYHPTAFNNIRDFTYAAWIKSYDYSSGDWQTIMDLGYDEQQFAVVIGKLTIYGRCNASNIGTIDGEWHYVAWTVSGTNYRVYIDGKEVKSGGSCTSSINVDTLWIGDSDGEVFRGILDEVGFYKRALTSAEIQKMYAESFYKRMLAGKI